MKYLTLAARSQVSYGLGKESFVLKRSEELRGNGPLGSQEVSSKGIRKISLKTVIFKLFS